MSFRLPRSHILRGTQPRLRQGRRARPWRFNGTSGLLLAACIGCTAAPLQAETAYRHNAAATNDTLYISISDPDESLVLERPRIGTLRPGAILAGQIADLVATDQGAVAFLIDGHVFELRELAWQRGRDLPRGATRLALCSEGERLYAVISSAAAHELPRFAERQSGETATEFSPRSTESLSLVCYERQQWWVIEECPSSIQNEPGRIALAATSSGVLLVWTIEPEQIESLRLRPDEGLWRAGQIRLKAPNLVRFWLPVVGAAPYLVTYSRSPDAGAQLRAYHWTETAEPDAPPAELRSASLQFADTPKDGEPAAVLGFNDHFGVLWLTRPNHGTLRFARVGGAPIEASIDINAELEKLQSRTRWGELGIWGILGLAFAGLALLLVFRPVSLSRPLPLPTGAAPALFIQRVGAAAIDLAPFATVWALILHVNVSTSLTTLWRWESSSATAIRDALLWWGATSVSYTAYCFIMELLTGRTAGKALLGLRVTNERGDGAGMGRTLVRNLVRLVELAPPFWVAVLLVALSANRQRLGDVLARTLVISQSERAPEPPEPPVDSDAGPP